jgi:hypothetical protein
MVVDSGRRPDQFDEEEEDTCVYEEEEDACVPRGRPDQFEELSHLS